MDSGMGDGFPAELRIRSRVDCKWSGGDGAVLVDFVVKT
jgi:hypothetical protein